jgi:hypothetical protein
MKKIDFYAGILVWIAFVSCVDLAESPESFISPEQFYKTEKDAVSAVNAIYYSFADNAVGNQPVYNSLFNTGMDFMTDDLDAGPGSPNPDVRALAKLNHSLTNLRGKEIWQQHYISINQANTAYERIPDIQMNEKLKNRLLGEILFLRALSYFNLVRLYGDVPLLLEDQTQISLAEQLQPRTPKDEVYTQIIEDLEGSASYFHNSEGSAVESGRPTEGAAKALLSKVYLTKRDWENAVKLAEEVIGNGGNGPSHYGYDLFEDYSHVFLPAYKNGKEHIFSIQFKNGVRSNQVCGRDVAAGVPGIKGTYGDQVAFWQEGDDKYFSIYKLYSPKDKRRDVTFTKIYISPKDGKTYYGSPVDSKTYDSANPPSTPIPDSIPYINKYWDPNYPATDVSEANAPVLRFAEILLIHAEAENEWNGATGKAYASLNRVRRRAGLDDLIPGLDKDDFRDSVYLDRRLEVFGEYQRYFDLIRQTGREITGTGPEGRGTLIKNLQKAGKTNVKPKHYLYPIPQVEIERNPKLTQNPGWEEDLAN